MIISIKGSIVHKSNNYIILENQGIGYQIHFNDLDKVRLGEETTLYIHDYIREDRRDLYGFTSLDELHFFLKLLSISGVGPKMAQHILALGIENLQKSIMEGSSALIEGVSGVGKKTAQKIILELKGSIDKILEEKNLNKDVVNGLIGLGYSRNEAEDALRQVASEVLGTEAQLKAALKLLGR
ncbi:Holliday junction branch migration protein RuvA [Candidatus Parcubacteria bacterium]|nr:Holliday junction branch migration protein RuvA [Patescibacteria group bacterium]MCG2694232.1 Holliday junction branch migration protein RuvA [Candidatus Parcubacteria bacterium]